MRIKSSKNLKISRSFLTHCRFYFIFNGTTMQFMQGSSTRHPCKSSVNTAARSYAFNNIMCSDGLLLFAMIMIVLAFAIWMCFHALLLFPMNRTEFIMLSCAVLLNFCGGEKCVKNNYFNFFCIVLTIYTLVLQKTFY